MLAIVTFFAFVLCAEFGYFAWRSHRDWRTRAIGDHVFFSVLAIACGIAGAAGLLFHVGSSS